MSAGKETLTWLNQAVFISELDPIYVVLLCHQSTFFTVTFIITDTS